MKSRRIRKSRVFTKRRKHGGKKNKNATNKVKGMMGITTEPKPEDMKSIVIVKPSEKKDAEPYEQYEPMEIDESYNNFMMETASTNRNLDYYKHHPDETHHDETHYDETHTDERKVIDNEKDSYEERVIPYNSTVKVNGGKNTKKISCKLNKKRSKKVVGGGDYFDWTTDLTPALQNEFQSLTRWTDENCKCVSIYNPGIAMLADVDGVYTDYIITTRVNFYTVKTDDSRNIVKITPSWTLSSQRLLDDQDIRDFYNYPLVGIKKMNYTARAHTRHPVLWEYDNSRSPNPDYADRYVMNPGAEFGKWLSPCGSWGKRTDMTDFLFHEWTMISVFRVLHENYTIRPLLSTLTPYIVDARVINSYSETHTDIDKTVHYCHVTGTNMRPCDPPAFAIDSNRGTKKHNIIFPNLAVTTNYNGPTNDDCQTKTCVINVQAVYDNSIMGRDDPNNMLLTFEKHGRDLNEDPFYSPQEIVSKVQSLANTIGWCDNGDKNYGLYTFQHDDPARLFCQRACIILNYHMTGENVPTNYPRGVIFYLRLFYSASFQNIYDGYDIDYPEETNNDRRWQIVVSPDSDIFIRLADEYKIRHDRYPHDLHISCTTPFITIPSRGSLYAIGHMKHRLFYYMAHYIETHFEPGIKDLLMQKYNHKHNRRSAAAITQAEVTRIRAHITHHCAQNKIFKIGMDIIRWFVVNVMRRRNSSTDGKYVIKCNPGSLRSGGDWDHNINWQWPFTHGGLDRLRGLLILEKFLIVESPESSDIRWVFPKNLHQHYVYYMFIYKINPITLALESFSHPFLIMPSIRAAALNFPMGIARGPCGKIYLTYGDGDVQSLISTFPEDRFDALASDCNNATPVREIDFRLMNQDGNLLSYSDLDLDEL